jgi:hypothetical protein
LSSNLNLERAAVVRGPAAESAHAAGDVALGDAFNHISMNDLTRAVVLQREMAAHGLATRSGNETERRPITTRGTP